MVIVKIWGGLGNQMFQYALHLSYQKKGIRCKLDKSFYESEVAHNGYELKRIFNIKDKEASTFEKLLVKPIAKLSYTFFNYPYDEKKWGYGYYNNRVANLKFGYLKGYWQTEKYFKQIKTELRTVFQFPVLEDGPNSDMLKKIIATNAVSVHIRRGDYLLNNRNWAIDTVYYKNAISFINEKIPDAFFYVFSDDITWAKDNIIEKNIEFIDWNKRENSYKDMQLMSNCRHNIIANSSFSWWGAWLNNNPEKIIIAPNHWPPGFTGSRDIVPDNWIKISEK